MIKCAIDSKITAGQAQTWLKHLKRKSNHRLVFPENKVNEL